MVTGVGHFLKTFYRRKYFADYGCEGVMWFNNIGLGGLESVSGWSELLVPARLSEFLELDMKVWVASNLDVSGAFAREPLNWDLMFVVLLWSLWLARNAKVFDAPQLEESSVIGSSSRLVSMMVQARAECQLDCPHVATISWGLTYWEPPPFAWIKLNTNEAWHESDGA
ncbi:hypothetical protein V6N13_020166 [Hibiscus sabdariffa]